MVFNRKLLEFLDDVKPLLGHLPEYTMMMSSAGVASKLQPGVNQQVFDAYVAVPFEEQIMRHDETFFLEKQDYSRSAARGGLVSLLKAIWGDLSSHNKDAIWQHLKVLVVLNRRCQLAS